MKAFENYEIDIKSNPKYRDKNNAMFKLIRQGKYEKILNVRAASKKDDLISIITVNNGKPMSMPAVQFCQSVIGFQEYEQTEECFEAIAKLVDNPNILCVDKKEYYEVVKAVMNEKEGMFFWNKFKMNKNFVTKVEFLRGGNVLEVPNSSDRKIKINEDDKFILMIPEGKSFMEVELSYKEAENLLSEKADNRVKQYQ
jgi:hypothetical protein